MIPKLRTISHCAIVLALAILAGCAVQSKSETRGGFAKDDEFHAPAPPPASPREMAMRRAGFANEAQVVELGAGKLDLSELSAGQGDAAPGAEPSVPATDKPVVKKSGRQARLVVLTGSVKLATPEVDSVLDRAEAVAASLGGYTDRRDGAVVVLRVPVEKYDAAFAAVQGLGRVLDHQTRAQDVSDEYTDIVLQIRIKRMYLQKLQEILAKETEMDRRKPLIQEIQTLTESVELLERRQNALKRDVAFSTITVSCERVQTRSRTGYADDLAVFRWIHQLQARMTDDRSPNGKRLKLSVPSGMVELPLRDSKLEWMAASPDGCEFRARALDNQPVGDADFWREALRLRLAGGFRSADTLSLGGWKALHLRSTDPGAWGWLLAVRIREDKLQLAQGFCPDSALDRRMRPAFEKALREVTP
ncbi:MAG: DUF4349 domain-containing protein [Fibrobacterota bacterium]